MTRPGGLATIVALVCFVLALPAPSRAFGSSQIAAVQVALRARHLYMGTVDGELGPATSSAVAAFQRQAGLAPDGALGPQTIEALGPLAGPELGTRPLAPGS